MSKEIAEAVEAYQDKQFEYDQFLSQVLVFFQKHPKLNEKPFPLIHSLKSRLKDPKHLEDKLERKLEEGIVINKDNIFIAINDFIGVRVLHLYQEQFPEINAAINKKIEDGDWVYLEPPKAFSWDPESKIFFENLNISTELRDTYYTSIHYLVKPNNSQNTVCCEIQVRTLFEEIWGEIDHTINYPHKSDSLACKEQLRVLAKLVSTGTRLADSIFRTHNDFLEKQVIDKNRVFEATVISHQVNPVSTIDASPGNIANLKDNSKIEIIFTNQQPADELGDNNDHILDKVFDISNTNFEIDINPQITKFWRFGFVFSQDSSQWPNLANGRHSDSKFGYIHIGVGDRATNTLWFNENILAIATYEVGDPKYIVVTDRYYGQKVKLKVKKVKVNLEKEVDNWMVTLEVGNTIVNHNYNLSKFTFCKIAAWCDGSPFEILTEIKTD